MLKETDVVTGSTAGLAQQLRLDRAARNAGEAFAFVESDLAPTRRVVPIGGVALAFFALATLTALYFGL
jgi:hypothetical protein